MTADEEALSAAVRAAGLPRVHTRRIIEAYERARRESVPAEVVERVAKAIYENSADGPRIIPFEQSCDERLRCLKMARAVLAAMPCPPPVLARAAAALIGYCESLDAGTVVTQAHARRLREHYLPNLHAALAAMQRAQVQDTFKAGSGLNLSEEMEEALRQLVALKDYKDTAGITPHYEREQPLAWERARRALARVAEIRRRV